jgi:hypothetical protein
VIVSSWKNVFVTFPLFRYATTRRQLGLVLTRDRAVEIVQVVAIAIAGGLQADQLAKIPLSFPTYAGILGRAAYRIAQHIYPEFGGRMLQPERISSRNLGPAETPGADPCMVTLEN